MSEQEHGHITCINSDKSIGAAATPTQESLSAPATTIATTMTAEPTQEGLESSVVSTPASNPSPVSSPNPASTPASSSQSALANLFTDLSRHVSVEASVVPIALYAPRSRSASTSAGSVKFPETVTEHKRERDLQRQTQRERGIERPQLPRIDSEKTLAPSEYCPTLDRDESKSHTTDISEKSKRPRTRGEHDAHEDEDEDDHEHDDASSDESAGSAEGRGPSGSEEEEVPIPQMSNTRKVLLGGVIMLDVFLASASTNAVVLTIPTMAADLGVSQLEAQWVSSAYALAYGCGLLFAGRLADIYGRKMLFLGGLAMTAIFAIVAGVIRSHIPLCVVRAMAGLGLAIATPAGFGIIGVTFREEPGRTIAFAVFGLGNPVGAAVGMVMGGAVAGIGTHGWSYLYFLLAGIAIVPLVIGIWVVPRDTRPASMRTDKRIDWLGALLITAALCLFTFSITQSGIAPKGWKTPYIPTLLVLSVLLFIAFGFWEYHVEHRLSFPPIAKLSLFTRNGGKITWIILIAFCAFVAISGWVYLVSLFYQDYKGLSALGNAVRLLPACTVGIFASLAVMYLVPRVRAPIIISSGGFLTGVACLLFAVEPAGTIYWACEFIALICLPFGADLTVGIGSILMSNLCEEDEQSVAGALFQTATQVASALGICLGSLVSAQVYAETGDYLTGLRRAWGMNVAWAWAVVVITFVFLRKMGLAKDVGHGRAIH